MNSSFLESLGGLEKLEENLYRLSESTDGKIVFSTSFGIEDQVITHAIFSQNLKNIEVFTIDTGRLFPETYATWNKTLLHYNKKITSYNPNNFDLEEFVSENGINPFYTSQELRVQCCTIRKMIPLKRALQGASVWITGLRSGQSENRKDLSFVEWDSLHRLHRYNPLLKWSTEDVINYVKRNGIPYNPLHDKGFVSIGCAPCTRAVAPGEGFRTGR